MNNPGRVTSVKKEEQKPKVLVTEALPFFDKEKSILEKYADVKLARGVSVDDICSEAKDVSVIMVGLAKINREVIYSAQKLKGIVRYGIGVDNIDLKAAAEKGVLVANVPDYCITTVAEHTFALLLALTRKIINADKFVRDGSWGLTEELRGTELGGKVYGIIGLGRIGREVATRAKAFKMKVIAYDPYVTKDEVDELNVELVDLDTLLRKSDFISIHAPLTEETRNMIGERELHMMKKTAYLINVARGHIVDENMLYKALTSGWIAGAALDVFEKEPPDPNNPLVRAKLDNVVLTPHIAAYTEESFLKLEMSAVEEAIRILKGELPKNLVRVPIRK